MSRYTDLCEGSTPRQLTSPVPATEKTDWLAWPRITYHEDIDRFIVIPKGTFDEYGIEPHDTCAYLADMSLSMLAVKPSEALTNAKSYIERVHEDAPPPSLHFWNLSDASEIDPTRTARSLIVMSRLYDGKKFEGEFVIDDDGLSYFKCRLPRNPVHFNARDEGPEVPINSVRCYMTAEEAWEMSEAVRSAFIRPPTTCSEAGREVDMARGGETQDEGASGIL